MNRTGTALGLIIAAIVSLDGCVASAAPSQVGMAVPSARPMDAAAPSATTDTGLATDAGQSAAPSATPPAPGMTSAPGASVSTAPGASVSTAPRPTPGTAPSDGSQPAGGPTPTPGGETATASPVPPAPASSTPGYTPTATPWPPSPDITPPPNPPGYSVEGSVDNPVLGPPETVTWHVTSAWAGAECDMYWSTQSYGYSLSPYGPHPFVVGGSNTWTESFQPYGTPAGTVATSTIECTGGGYGTNWLGIRGQFVIP